MGNAALDVNPPNATYNLSTHGSDWLWTVFSIFGLSLFVITAWTFMRPRGARLFHQIAIVVITTGALSYFSMASDLGATPIPVEFRGTGTRQIWYVRYIQWFISFPLLLLELLLATGLSLSDIFTTLFMAIVLVVTGLVGALVPSTYKWGYYTFGLLALIYIWSVSIVIALSEGANVITVTSEMIWFGILDILAGPVFLFFFLWKLRGVDYAAFGLQSGKYTYNGVGEKQAATMTTTATGNGQPALDGGMNGSVARADSDAAAVDATAPTVTTSPSRNV
ncbi:hypothetical protein C8Q73DRAFT_786128 [Cubamyces lactineus]|nr:hypothetical protein C8Q73DRAFT_786128 [Cubamyces lactineus]